MDNRQPHPEKKRPDNPSCEASEVPLESAGEVVVEHHATPPRGPKDKQIHPRRPLPLVPKAPSPPSKKGNEDV